MEQVLKLNGVEVIYLHESDTFEVWAMVAAGPGGSDWDCVGVFDSSIDAVNRARYIVNKMERWHDSISSSLRM